MKILLRVVIIYFMVAVIIFFMQRSMIYMPALEKPDRAMWGALQMHEVSLHTADGLKLYAWYHPPKANKPTLVYFHGNAGHIGYRVFAMQPYIKQGFGALLVEYRGYGGNLGRPTEKGFYLDGEAAMDFLHQQGIKRQCTILVGVSLGTGVAVEMATRYKVGAVILQSPFSSLADVGFHHYPFLPVSLFLLDRYDSQTKIKSIHNTPLLVIYVKNDPIIPEKLSKKLYAEANEPKQIIAIEGDDHNTSHISGQFQQVKMFIDNALRDGCYRYSVP